MISFNNHIVHRSAKALVFALFALLPAALFASGSEAHAGHITQGATSSTQYDPTPMIMHHIADANEWHVVGSVSVPLPVFIYNRSTGQHFMGMSSAFHAHHGDGTVEVAGYKMEHSRVKPVSEEEKYIDFSITKNVATMLMVSVLLIIIFLSTARAYKRRQNEAPRGLQAFMEPLILFVRNEILVPNLGKHADKYAPYLMTAFFFIWLNNIFGLVPILPGGANVTGNIAVTFVLAFLTLIVTNFSGNKHYWGHLFDPLGKSMPWYGKFGIYLILVPVELLGILTKPFALMMRLFANITGGHIIVLSLVSLIFVFGNAGQSLGGSVAGATVAVPFVLFISLIEILVAFLQAFVFTMLSAVFIAAAIEEPAHH